MRRDWRVGEAPDPGMDALGELDQFELMDLVADAAEVLVGQYGIREFIQRPTDAGGRVWVAIGKAE